jgi:alpha-N-arabinofuranosidase
MLSRRKFLQPSASAGAAPLIAKRFSLPPATADSRIEILPSESLGAISPNIYGHFTENLGGVIIDPSQGSVVCTLPSASVTKLSLNLT